MTTQAVTVCLGGPDFSVKFTNASCTDDAWTELKSSQGSNSLGKMMEGKTVDKAIGYYTAGSGMFRIRNIQKGIKYIMGLPIVTEEKMTLFEEPILIERDDVIEAFCVAVPT